jgi:hypothetical protein
LITNQPETRQGLLDGLQAKGYAAAQLQVISRAVNANTKASTICRKSWVKPLM